MAHAPALINADDVLRDADPRLLVDALLRSHQQPVEVAGRFHASIAREGRADAEALVWLGSDRAGGFGAKVIAISPDNAQHMPGADAAEPIHSAYVLFDGEAGRVRALIHGNAFTRYKTAADSALGARLLARANPETLVVIGTGAQAATHIAVMAAEFPSLRRISVWSRSHEKAVALVAGCRLPHARDVALEAVVSLEAAVARADLVVSATSATSPVLKGAWLRPGTHVDLVGSYTPAMREADDDAVRLARVYVDHRALVMEHCGDITQPIASGAIRPEDVLGDLFGLCGGTVEGRRGDADITLFKNGGGGHLDLMIATWMLEYVSGQACRTTKPDRRRRLG
ncbi:ornithine cyclodeaminase family protein [Burkholderia sp. Ac-20379]|uniref:ornithine cyclodeaminase family protein n=1 Tax=Burkholderia sp. Ac-20379 TaxID=2703900 RepID=UPI0019814675|nr:ornithine cyclodeaminase family protein [Burkholderia sp. Ac-20379]MBN3723896.1 ornithine cyclodeaminase [Burkholderia sp. Ac-20379]